MKTIKIINKSHLSYEIKKYIGFSNQYSKKILDDLIEIIKLQTKKDFVILKNFGLFKTIDKKERIGRNPKTMEEFLIKSRKSISFSSSKKLQKKLNK